MAKAANGETTFKPLGRHGVQYAVTADQELILRVPFKATDIAAAPMSKSGKNKLIGSTGGFVYGLAEAPSLGISINVTAKQ